MLNELLFLAHVIVVSATVVWGLWYSYGALLAVLSLQLILANLFVTKQIMLFGIETTCSEVFVVGGMYGICLMRAYYNEVAARQAINTTFGFLVLFVGLVQFHVAYLGVDLDTSVALAAICHSSVRLLVASLCAYLISERTHLLLCRLLDKHADSLALQVVAIIGGQAVDTVVFGIVGLYGVVDHLLSVILFSFVIKVLVILLLSPLLTVTRLFIPAKN